MAALKRILVIVGSTGAGKSQIAVDVARAIGGEIINADAMQMYAGLDIATNKMSAEEQSSVPHHLLGFVQPYERLQVPDFRRLAVEKIDDVTQRDKRPVIVGGTNYYLQSLLWNTLLDDSATSDEERALKVRRSIPASEAVDLHNQLAQIDPAMATRLHPNDSRRIRRYLDLYAETGQLPSEMIRQQQQREKEGSTLAFDCCILHATADNLQTRINQRVDTMMERGLLKEVTEMRSLLLSKQVPLNAAYGITQSIGFKEFEPYFACADAESPIRDKTLAECVERVKISTRQYARSQQKWIRRFSRTTGVPMYDVSTDNMAEAIAIADAFFRKQPITATPVVVPDETISGLTHADIDEWKKYTCTVCNKTLNGTKEWTLHFSTRGHRKRIKRTRDDTQDQRHGRGDRRVTYDNTDDSLEAKKAQTGDKV